jgi:hypothetical protein
VARAEYEDDLWAHGDDRGVYGEYPPDHQGRVPELHKRADAPQRRPKSSAPPEPSEPPATAERVSRDQPNELERQVATQEAEAKRRRAATKQAANQERAQFAREAAEGRDHIDQFVALMRKRNVPVETIYRKSMGPTIVTYDTVVGRGWAISLRPDELHQWRPFMAGVAPAYTMYILPGLGLAKAVPVLLGQKTVKVLVYPTEPDDSDQGYRAWANRGSELASRAQTLIAEAAGASPRIGGAL